jgi:hypothetical protein
MLSSVCMYFISRWGCCIHLVLFFIAVKMYSKKYYLYRRREFTWKCVEMYSFAPGNWASSALECGHTYMHDASNWRLRAQWQVGGGRAPAHGTHYRLVFLGASERGISVAN